MESKLKDGRHIIKKATNLTEATCLGRYMGVTIEKVLVNVPIVGAAYTDDESSEVKFTLIRVAYSNFWDYRISTGIRTGVHDIQMIDSEGFQHSAGLSVYEFNQKAEVKLSKNRRIKCDFISPENRLEGNAKTRGWLWFPAIPQGVFPYRFIFHFQISKPENVSGEPQDYEILEIVFDSELKQFLLDEKRFATLELGNT